MKGFAILTGLLATGASAHMQMSKPYPIRSPLNKDSNEQKDYSYNNPLNPSGADYPCKGYANDAFQSQASYSPGQTYELELDGSATHSGGSCQLALTYDRGKTFKVIESMLGECPISQKYEFAIPSDAPAGEALLAWTWFNKVGNREMYMNCAMVTIGGSASSGNKTQSTTTNGKNSHGKNFHGAKMMGKHMASEEMKHLNHPPMEHTMERRDTADTTVMTDKSKTAAFDSLPELFVANVAQTGGCVTIEGEEVDFPLPGPNVVGKIDSSGKGYKCTGTAPFLASDSTASTATTAGTSAASSASSSSTSSTSTASSNSTTASNATKSDSTKNNNSSSSSSSKKADAKKTTSTASSSTTTAATTLAQAMSQIASAFGSPSADPRVLGSQSNNQVASTSNSFANYVTKWTCTSGEILCSPDGYSWAMCSNSRPIFMGNVAPGMICQLGQMVRSSW
ncbi:hypothetical protein PEBR_12744 [Penicillium brasilianum]|uniref:Extracellular protein n=1 Tax=Penicillium brasilianum TaxID=104259 RepID=A0A1S9RTF8_PENBI|nr:hypothetical protein PEBR_12744 [Penicillium brasilianum]